MGLKEGMLLIVGFNLGNLGCTLLGSCMMDISNLGVGLVWMSSSNDFSYSLYFLISTLVYLSMLGNTVGSTPLVIEWSDICLVYGLAATLPLAWKSAAMIDGNLLGMIYVLLWLIRDISLSEILLIVWEYNWDIPCFGGIAAIAVVISHSN